MKIKELLENKYHHGHADPNAPQLGAGEKRDRKRTELDYELGHETNNIAIDINGKTWKVIIGKGTAGSPEEYKYLQHMKDWAEKKSASTGKKWTVHLTGAKLTNESLHNRLQETATAGATSAASIGTVVSPHIAIGRRNISSASYTGSPGKSGTKAPKLPKITQPKNKDGTAKNGLDIKGSSLFGGPTNAKANAKTKKH